MSKTPRIEYATDREPINLQTAMVMRKPSWIHQPPIGETVPKEVYEAVKAELESLKLKMMAVKRQLASTSKKLDNSNKQLLDAKKEIRTLTNQRIANLKNLTGSEAEESRKIIAKSEVLLKLAELD